MSRPEEISVQPLPPTELARNVALAHSVGWPDDEAEWRVMHEAALVLGVHEGENLIGQGALVKFEPGAGTIAKMIVAPSAQRRGIGAKILDGLLGAAERDGLKTLGLVATPLGQPLYASRGFERTGEIAVFIGEPKLDRRAERVAAIEAIEKVVAFERTIIACSRATVLRRGFRGTSASTLCKNMAGELTGFAFASPKPNASHTVVGPVIAEDEACARELVRGVLAAVSGSIRIDVPAAQSSFQRWLAELGLQQKGGRVEMARGGPLPWQVSQRFALAAPAWG